MIDNTDITFVVDTSGSINETRFQYVRKFMEDIVMEMNIGINNSRVAVILFNDQTMLFFDLNHFTNKSLLIESIQTLPYLGGGTDISGALDRLRTVAQNGTLGINMGNRQIAIVLTAGDDSDVEPSVGALAATNIFQVYSVGVDGARLDQLNLIALHDSDHVYYQPNFTDSSLVFITESIIERLKGKHVCMLLY